MPCLGLVCHWVFYGGPRGHIRTCFFVSKQKKTFVLEYRKTSYFQYDLFLREEFVVILGLAFGVETKKIFVLEYRKTSYFQYDLFLREEYVVILGGIPKSKMTCL